MNQDAFRERWDRFRGEAQARWDGLTDEDLAYIDGDWDMLIDALQERYGWDRKRAMEEMERYFDELYPPVDRV